MGMNPLYDAPAPEGQKDDSTQCKGREGDAEDHLICHYQCLHSGLTGPKKYGYRDFQQSPDVIEGDHIS